LQHERARQNEREKEREKGGEGLSIERSEINFVKREVAAIIITKIWHSVRLDTAGLQDLRVNVHFRSDLTLNVERERERERERECNRRANELQGRVVLGGIPFRHRLSVIAQQSVEYFPVSGQPGIHLKSRPTLRIGMEAPPRFFSAIVKAYVELCSSARRFDDPARKEPERAEIVRDSADGKFGEIFTFDPSRVSFEESLAR